MKKCLVLDCDNVLWGGIIGEDGIDGIKLDTSNSGSVYYEFQRVLLTLFNRGVVLALCSKNNEDDVWDVFDKHPNMLLKREHISAYRINWENKADNISDIASELNLSLEHCVFADDSEFEIESVKELLSEVATIQIPLPGKEDPKRVLQDCGYFENLSVTDEDKNRAMMYQAEKKRSESSVVHHNIEDFLKTLEIEISVQPADEINIQRIAQLTQRTNQFNLSTRRYSEADIKRYSQSEDHMIFCASVKDKFGDFGIVAALIADREGDTCFVDTFLMSCRILGRKIELAFLDTCYGKIVNYWGINKWSAEYIPTKKNRQVEQFWDNCGYEVIRSDDGKKYYEMDEASRKNSKYEHIKVRN